jgi:anion-transporting  ArsA/GET3 family ATPase
MAAALSLAGAIDGKNVEVMTVDPAPRLLDALGLKAESGEPQEVGLDGIGAKPGGRIRALKLDPKRTFDSLVETYAPSAAVSESILANRLYQNISRALAGVSDYMAIEKFLELYGDPVVELLVLDTPPSREALDFLDAPNRLLDLLNSRAAALLGASRGFLGQSLKFADYAARAVLAAFDRLTRLHLLAEVQAFVESFGTMYTGFAERARRAQELLRSDLSFVVVVTTPEALRVEETRSFLEALGAAGIKVGALVVNRMQQDLPKRPNLKDSKLSTDLKRRVRLNWENFEALRHRDTVSLNELRSMVGADTMVVVAPDLGHQPRTLAELAELARSLREI